MERELCGWLICGDPERPCVLRPDHLGDSHRDIAYIHAKRQFSSEWAAANPERKRESGRRYSGTAKGMLKSVRDNAKRRGNR